MITWTRDFNRSIAKNQSFFIIFYVPREAEFYYWDNFKL